MPAPPKRRHLENAIALFGDHPVTMFSMASRPRKRRGYALTMVSVPEESHGVTPRLPLLLAAVAGFTAVAVGAFGAHALEGRVEPGLLDTFETGARYHMYHALALLGCAATGPRLGRAGTAAVWCFAAGIVVFSGSLYALALTGERWLGAVTPVGGVMWLIGWGALGVGAVRGGGRWGDRAAEAAPAGGIHGGGQRVWYHAQSSSRPCWMSVWGS